MANGAQTIFDSFYSRFVLRDFFGKVIPGGTLLFTIAVSASSPSDVFKYVASMSSWTWVTAFGVSWVTAFAIQSFGEKPLPWRPNPKFIRKFIRRQFIRYYPEHWFTVDNESLATELDGAIIPKKLRKAFDDNALTLNEEATVKKDDQQWEITDEGRTVGTKFIVEKKGQKLNIYSPEAETHKLIQHLYLCFSDIALPHEKQNHERLVVIKEACGNMYVGIAISLLVVLVDTLVDTLRPPASSEPWLVVLFLAINLVLFAPFVWYLRQMHFIHVQRQHDCMVVVLKFHQQKKLEVVRQCALRH